MYRPIAEEATHYMYCPESVNRNGFIWIRSVPRTYLVELMENLDIE
jgi:hypothetical protein